MGNNIKHNIFLPLMTDILPYELPVLFTNKYFYKFLKSNYDEYYDNICTTFEENKNKQLNIYRNNILNINMFIKSYGQNDNLGLLLLQQYIDDDSIPMLFHIKKNNNAYRTMSIIHPASQINICDLYHKYENEILFYTNKGSDFSLRHPYKKDYKYMDIDMILKKYINLDLDADSGHDSIINDDYTEEEFQVRYFSYRKYLYINSFYNSQEYKDLEKKFDLCSMFDIKKCFDSIYTHSIAWAVKGIEAAKNNRNINCFENKIDKVMRACNWGETHGILIGSEFSRIFAEIILQKIDIEVVKKIEIENENVKLKKGIDYDIKRYVDNYFVFANNEELLKKIRHIYNEKLEQYKLFTNSDKDVLLHQPFITDLTILKTKINILFKDILNFNITNEIDEKTYNNIIENSNKNFKYCLNNLRILISEHDISGLNISSFINKKIKRYIEYLWQSIHKKKKKYINVIINNLQTHLDYILDITSYIYSIGANYSSTIITSKIYYLIILISKKIKLSNKYYNRIYNDIIIFYDKNYNKTYLFEYIELFYILDTVSKKNPLPYKFIDNLIQCHKNDITYIELMILLLYIKDKEEYKNIKNIILEIIKTKYKESSTLMKSSELFMMFFDIIRCPYIDNSYKKEIIDLVKIPELLNKKEIDMGYDDIITNIQSSFYFFEWPDDRMNSSDIVLENNYPIKQLYLKKELHFSS